MKPILRNKDKGDTLTRYKKSIRHALSGFWYAIKYEHNMIVILFATFIVTFAGLRFNISAYEWLFCITIIAMIMATELINSAVEAVVDLETTEYHPLAKIAKDTASAATLTLVIASVIGGLIIFLPKIIALL